jgi:hypothetical protein
MPLRIILGFALALVASGATAFTITDVNIVNDSSENEDEEQATFPSSPRQHSLEFFTSHEIGSPAISGGAIELTTQFRFYNGFRGEGGFAQLHKRNVVYDLLFTVQDEQNSGYTLDISTRALGYAAALWTTGTSSVRATGIDLSGRFDEDMTDGLDTLTSVAFQLVDLTIVDAVTAISPVGGGLVTVLQDSSTEFSAGEYEGTRQFGLRFTSVITPTTNVLIQNDDQGQGSVRFGLSNISNTLDATGAGLPGDLNPSDLGHFVTLRVAPRTTTIPAPSAISIFVLGLAGLFFTRRRRLAGIAFTS